MGPTEPSSIRTKAVNPRMCMFAQREVKFWLHDLSVAINAGFPAHEIGDIVRHLRVNREELLDAWNEHFRN
jgi:hypothetical protein